MVSIGTSQDTQTSSIACDLARDIFQELWTNAIRDTDRVQQVAAAGGNGGRSQAR
jgi:hypothetical protein